jgi:hypothetical protein
MAKRGQKSTQTDGPDEYDRRAIRTLLRKAGSLDTLVSWIKDELCFLAIEQRDEDILPSLAWEEENIWRHQRSPKARLKARPYKLLTREEMISKMVNALYPGLRPHEKKNTVRRLTQKLRLRLRMSKGPR